ncbi:hypothetical protein HOLleu_14420 [Holothuria leucospilota]|uniref:Uncharacterized protein n=1 Tax=Holothuria leucospilota TaxID=206669 RepID=A0A9Q1C8A1_HOLLE|nr:hypothetical protein HOLleu_14420 [Holothuria leucospilota]
MTSDVDQNLNLFLLYINLNIEVDDFEAYLQSIYYVLLDYILPMRNGQLSIQYCPLQTSCFVISVVPIQAMSMITHGLVSKLSC